MPEIRNKTLDYAFSSLAEVVKETLPEYLNDDNVKINIAPAAVLSLVETEKVYAVITFSNDNSVTEAVDRTVPVNSRDFVIYIGAHDNTELIKMYDELMSIDPNTGLYKICAKGGAYFELLNVKLGSNPFIIYDTGLCELVVNVTVTN